MDAYMLKHPIKTAGGETMIADVILRRPKGKDLKAADKAATDLESTFILLDRLAQTPDGNDVFPGFAEELDAEDIVALGERLDALLPSGPKTGGTT